MATGSARSLLLTILGELVYPRGDPVWTSSLLYVMSGLGVEEQTARQTIARSAAAGWLIGERHGREVCWRLSSDVKRLIESGMRRVYSLDHRSEPWDGNWLIVLVTVPNSHRAARKRLYKALEWSGFGSPSPGVWLNPSFEQESEVRRIIRDLELVEWTLSFRGSAGTVGLSEEQIVRRGWGDLDEVEAVYRELLERYTAVRPVAHDLVLFSQLELVSRWQRLPFLDPRLPEELLPEWIGRRAVSVIRQRRAEWHEAAQARWLEVIEEVSRRGAEPAVIEFSPPKRAGARAPVG
jgi:phenylacetic acid degradation operon negative regulatory protein